MKLAFETGFTCCMCSCMARSTISDVASLAGVSKKTVSFVVNGSGPVGAQTRARVEAAVRQLGYIADPQARAMAGGRSALVLLVHDVSGDGVLLPLIESMAGALGTYGPALAPVRFSGPRSLAALIEVRRPQAIVLLPPLGSDRAIASLCEDSRCLAVPVLPMAHDGADHRHSLVIDQRRAASIATSWLIALGHSRIGFIAGPDDDAGALARELGFIDAMADAGLEGGAEIVAQGDFSLASGEVAGALLLQVSPHPTAILAASDAMAAGAMRTVRAAGLAVPGDLSVMGFGDCPAAALLDPPLATMRLPWPELGVEIARLLAAPDAYTPVIIGCELVPGATVAAINGS